MTPFSISSVLLVVGFGVATLVILLGLIVRKRRRRGSGSHQLFGSTIKVAPRPMTAAPSGSLMRVTVQPGQPLQPVNSENDLERFGAPYKERGLSSRLERWSSIDKGVDNYNERSTAASIDWKLWFKIEYAIDERQLVVTVFRAKANQEVYSSHIDTSSFVIVYLLPDECCKQTALYPNNGSPSFDECFSFNVDVDDLVKRRLRLSLYDMDASRTRICLGHSIVNIADISQQLLACQPQYICKDLQQLAAAMDSPSPEIHLSLCFNPQKEKLKMQIFAARNIDEAEDTDVNGDRRQYYMRTNVVLGTRSAKVKRTNQCPSIYGLFQCSYAFQIPSKLIDQCCLKLAIIQVDINTGVESLYGSLIVGPATYTHGTTQEHWKEMLSNTRKTVEMWHRLVIGEDASRGHALVLDRPMSPSTSSTSSIGGGRYKLPSIASSQ